MFSSFFKKKDKSDSSDSKEKDSKGSDGDDFELEVGAEEPERPLLITEFVTKLAGQDEFSDVTFVVGKGKKQRVIPGHRIILAAASPLFEAILYPPVFPDYEGKDDGEDLTVFVPDEDPDIFQSLLEGIYSDKVELNTSNLMPLIEIAKKYQIEKMQAICADFMSNDISTDNACEIFQLGPDLLGDSDVALDFICENADEVFESKGFLNLSKERLAVLVRNDGLGIDEGPLLQAVIKWGKHELKRREIKETSDELKDVLKDLIPHIRFPSLDVTELASTVADSGLLSEDQLLSLFQYIAIKDEKDRQRVPCAFNSKPRGGGFICKESKLLSRKFKRDLLGFFGKDVKKLELKLLYRGSRDGFTAAAFHRLCDNKGATLTVVKAQGSKNIFGGYASGSWSSSGSYNTQPAWIFSLVNSTGKPLKLLPTSPSNNVYCNSSYGPTWGGGHDLHINSNMKTNNNYTNPSSFRTVAPGYSGTFEKTLFAGEYKFVVDELEVFTVSAK